MTVYMEKGVNHQAGKERLSLYAWPTCYLADFMTEEFGRR